MIHLLSLSLVGGLLAFVAQPRRETVLLVETLVVAEKELPSLSKERSLLSRLEEITPEQNLALSIGLLGMTTMGNLGLPLLRFSSLPGLFYLDFYFVRYAYQEWQAKRQIGIAISDGVLATALLVTGQWGADALFATLYFASRNLQALAEENLAHALSVEHLLEPDRENAAGIVDVSESSATDAPVPSMVAGVPAWHTWVDQGTLPFLTLSVISMPVLGVRRALAILLANFGYDYRIMAPMGTLSYLAVSKEQGILLRNGQVLEKLLQLDIVVIDGLLDPSTIAYLQAGTTIKIVSPTALGLGTVSSWSESHLVARIAQLQADGHRVAYLAIDSVNELAAMQADIFMSAEQNRYLGADLTLVGDPIAQLRRCFEMIPAITTNRKRGLYLAIVPSLLNLGGIYFLRFGVITALFVDYGGSVAGLLNALMPRF